LGLAICKQLADLMEAELSVKGNNGNGSCFSLDISLKKGIERRSGGREKADGLVNKKAMIICDDNHMEWILKRQLTHWGMELIEAQFFDLNGPGSKVKNIPEVIVANCQNCSSTYS